MDTSDRELVAITGLRGWLAWWVVLFHLGPATAAFFPASAPAAPLWASGDAAVDVFFVLSGFVITLSCERRLTPLSWGAFRAFLKARLARIYPVHVVQQVAWLVVVLAAARTGAHGLGADDLQWEGFARNFLLIHGWGVPMRMYWNYPAWSISMEWLAYLATPCLLTVSARARDSRAAALVYAVVAWLLLLAVEATPVGHFARIVCEFSVGMQVARLYRVAARPGSWVRAAALPVALGCWGGAALLTDLKRGYGLLVPAMALLVYLLASIDAPLPFVGGKVSRYLGRVSYSLYMSHALSITVLHQLLPTERAAAWGALGRGAAALFYLTTIGAAGALCYHVIEEPARRWWMGGGRPLRGSGKRGEVSSEVASTDPQV